MKKFLAVFDGYKMSNSTLNYAIQLSKVVNANLVGVFLDEFIYRNYNVVAVMKTNEDYTEKMKEMDAKDQLKRDEAAQHFQKACGKAGISYSIHRDKSIALQELKHESMFADLIIINEYETFTKYKEELPTRFMKDLLSDVQCPVLLVSNKFKPVDKIVLLYDGAPSSLYAIKMFSYLFGNFQDLPVEVFSVNERKANLRLPDNKLMREFIKRHFPKATYNVATGEAEEQILDYLHNHKENELIVLGAYRRSELSRWFKTSMADTLMRKLDTALFVAHNK
ncbi:universal stress protein [Ginsengibacter hankyongi]|uniref:Universal stress protein n=1 Tax=Ginsengibacter hankyongi TaxID=2607284 RepID=A0A5J5II53_9BACT|nr:universal stress protein [Ginsengibacter hankyongi]KAA9040586.1 universal stress protein [Ginsengibacter hankyongi]